MVYAPELAHLHDAGRSGLRLPAELAVASLRANNPSLRKRSLLWDGSIDGRPGRARRQIATKNGGEFSPSLDRGQAGQVFACWNSRSPCTALRVVCDPTTQSEPAPTRSILSPWVSGRSLGLTIQI